MGGGGGVKNLKKVRDVLCEQPRCIKFWRSRGEDFTK